jgi:hypothetical protein
LKTNGVLLRNQQWCPAVVPTIRSSVQEGHEQRGQPDENVQVQTLLKEYNKSILPQLLKHNESDVVEAGTPGAIYKSFSEKGGACQAALTFEMFQSAVLPVLIPQ